MIGRSLQLDNPVTEVTFALPPWDQHDPHWQDIDGRLPAHHLARRIDAAVDRLDLDPLFRSYEGRGSLPLRPDLMLKVGMYETAIGEPSPADWFRDTRNSDAVKWLGFGIQPARSVCYDFRDRLQPYWDAWNGEALPAARDQGFTEARRLAQDSTTIAAHASRRRLVNQDTLERRREELEAAIAADEQGQPPEQVRGWMAKHPHTRKRQRARYQRVTERMEELQLQNQQRRACKRRPPEKIVISTSDPESICGRDQWGVFRPLDNVQLNYDLDSPFILSYDVFPQANDNGTLETIDRADLRIGGRQTRSGVGRRDLCFDSRLAGEPTKRRHLVCAGQRERLSREESAPAADQSVHTTAQEPIYVAAARRHVRLSSRASEAARNDQLVEAIG